MKFSARIRLSENVYLSIVCLLPQSASSTSKKGNHATSPQYFFMTLHGSWVAACTKWTWPLKLALIWNFSGWRGELLLDSDKRSEYRPKWAIIMQNALPLSRRGAGIMAQLSWNPERLVRRPISGGPEWNMNAYTDNDLGGRIGHAKQCNQASGYWNQTSLCGDMELANVCFPSNFSTKKKCPWKLGDFCADTYLIHHTLSWRSRSEANHWLKRGQKGNLPACWQAGII